MKKFLKSIIHTIYILFGLSKHVKLLNSSHEIIRVHVSDLPAVMGHFLHAGY